MQVVRMSVIPTVVGCRNILISWSQERILSISLVGSIRSALVDEHSCWSGPIGRLTYKGNGVFTIVRSECKSCNGIKNIGMIAGGRSWCGIGFCNGSVGSRS